jgi:hypothetical protein
LSSDRRWSSTEVGSDMVSATLCVCEWSKWDPMVGDQLSCIVARMGASVPSRLLAFWGNWRDRAYVRSGCCLRCLTIVLMVGIGAARDIGNEERGVE